MKSGRPLPNDTLRRFKVFRVKNARLRAERRTNR
jgi:hypothetical protein